MRFIAPVKAGQHFAAAEKILPTRWSSRRGHLTVAELPVLASLGIAEVEVVRKVRVAGLLNRR